MDTDCDGFQNGGSVSISVNGQFSARIAGNFGALMSIEYNRYGAVSSTKRGGLRLTVQTPDNPVVFCCNERQSSLVAQCDSGNRIEHVHVDRCEVIE